MARQSQKASQKPSLKNLQGLQTPLVPGLDGKCNVQHARFLNREQGLLAFNERVLSLAANRKVPLLERLRFVAIVSNNLDEFFEVRIAELKQQMALGRGDAGAIDQAISVNSDRIRRLVDRQYQLLDRTILPAMAEQGIQILTTNLWTRKQKTWASNVFEEQIEPLLTPIAIDPAHPFPNVLNKSLNFIVELEGRDAFGRDADVAVVQAPRSLPRVLAVPESVCGVPHGFMLLTSIVLGFVDRLFPGLKVLATHQFRVTRNSDLQVDDDEVTDLLTALESELYQRHFGDSVRLEVSAGISDRLVDRLLTENDLEQQDCYYVNGPVNLNRLQQIIDMTELPGLKYQSFTPAILPALRGTDLFSSIARGDILLHHPYDSFAPVMEFLKSAASDPKVVAIKQTIYRTGSDSELMESLMAASRAGKAVTVVVELMARLSSMALSVTKHMRSWHLLCAVKAANWFVMLTWVPATTTSVPLACTKTLVCSHAAKIFVTTYRKCSGV